MNELTKMPSSLNDACRIIDELNDKLERARKALRLVLEAADNGDEISAISAAQAELAGE